MDVIINSDCTPVPEMAEHVDSQAELHLLSCVGYDPINPPLGDLLKTVHNLKGNWIVLSPIQWEASHNDAMIVALSKDLDWHEAESRHWFKLFADYLAHDHMELYYHNAHTWLLCVDNKPPLNALPVYQVLNHSLMPELAALDKSLYWQKFFTECQMFFAAHSSTSPVNGLWPWGAGSLGEMKSVPVDSDATMLPLAQAVSSKARLYNSSNEFKDIRILFLSDFDALSDEDKEKITKITTRWYWNNCTYTKTNPNWLIRLWRSVIHAH